MRNVLKTCIPLLLAAVVTLALAPPMSARKGKHHADLTVNEVLSQMNEASKKLHTLSANLEYTKVTVLVDDKSTES
jgi:hypothetical protein